MGQKKNKYRIAIDNLEKNVWFSLEEIQSYIKDNVEIKEDELRPTAEGKTCLIWEHDLYSTLSHMKSRGNAEYQPRISAKKSPDGYYHPPMYKFIEKEVVDRKEKKILDDSTKYERAFELLSKNVWYSLEEIINHVQGHVVFEPQELEYVESLYGIKWQHTVRVRLNLLYKKGLVEKKEHVRAIDSIDGNAEHVKYMFK